MKFSITLILSIILLLTSMQASEKSPTKEEVAKLYVATFNRAPDTTGLNYWINESFGGNPTLSGIASSFFDAPETKLLYPEGTSNRNFVKSVYANLFNREPDTVGWDYWEKELNEQKYSKNKFIITVIGGAKDDANGMDKTILTNKTEVGLYFANAGFGTDDNPVEVMSGVTADSDTVEFIKGVINNGAIGEDIWDNQAEISSETILTGTMYVYLKQDKNTFCRWNLTVDLSSDGSVSGNAVLTSHANDEGDCDSFAVGSGFFSAANDIVTLSVTDTSTDYVYGGNNFNFTVTNTTNLSESIDFNLYGYPATRETNLKVQ